MKHKPIRFRTIICFVVFFSVVFLLPAFRTGDSRLFILAAAIPGAMLLLLLLPSGILFLDRPLLMIALSLSAFGVLAPALQIPDESVSQALRLIPASLFLMAGVVITRIFKTSVTAAVMAAFLSISILCLPLVFPLLSFSGAFSGTVLMLFPLSVFLSLRSRLPALAFALSGLVLLLFSREMGIAAVWFFTILFVFWAASDSILWSVFSLLSCCACLAFFLLLFPDAVDVFPESLASPPVAFPLFAPEWTGSVTSTFTDSLLILLGKQYGLFVILSVVLLFCLFLGRGGSIAVQTRKCFPAALSLGAVLLLGLKALLFILFFSNTSPLPRASFPFMSAAVPDLFSDYFLLGILSGISAQNEADLLDDTRLAMLAH